MDLQSYLLRFLALFHIAQFGAMMQWGWWKGRSLSLLNCLNMWNYKNKALNKVQLMQWKCVHMWITRRIFDCIYQNLYLLKGPLFWKVFGLLAIGSWIVRNLSCCPQHWLLIWKIWSFVLIMGPRTWSWLPHTPHLEISTMEILFLWSFIILSLFGWEEHIVMLSRMIKMNSSKWWGCNGGCHEEMVKFRWPTFVWRLLEWQVEM